MFFPNVTYETEHIDFGCILNDTETIRYVSMTNNSPLEVRYTWSFLKRPPVQRLPDHDEGVDMESECETDSLEEEESGEESEEEEEEEGERSASEREMSAPSRPHSIHIQIAEKEAIVFGSHMDMISGSSSRDDLQGAGSHGDGEQKQDTGSVYSGHGNEVAPEEIINISEERQLSPVSEEERQQLEGGHSDDVIESGLPPGESQVEMVVPVEVEKTASDDEGSKVTKKKKKGKGKPHPWKLTYDPFTPISIEQVHTHTHVHVYCM